VCSFRGCVLERQVWNCRVLCEGRQVWIFRLLSSEKHVCSCRVLCVGRYVWSFRLLCAGRQLWSCRILCVGEIVDFQGIVCGETGVVLLVLCVGRRVGVVRCFVWGDKWVVSGSCVWVEMCGVS